MTQSQSLHRVRCGDLVGIHELARCTAGWFTAARHSLPAIHCWPARPDSLPSPNHCRPFTTARHLLYRANHCRLPTDFTASLNHCQPFAAAICCRVTDADRATLAANVMRYNVQTITRYRIESIPCDRMLLCCENTLYPN